MIVQRTALIEKLIFVQNAARTGDKRVHHVLEHLFGAQRGVRLSVPREYKCGDEKPKIVRIDNETYVRQ